MSANTYQMRFEHFRYQNNVPYKIFDFWTRGTQNWAQLVTNQQLEKKTFKSACKSSGFFDCPKVPIPEGKNWNFLCHMSANTYQLRFEHFRYQNVVPCKFFDFWSGGTQNWAQLVTNQKLKKIRSNPLVNPGDFSIAPKFPYLKGKSEIFCATCPQIHTKRDFITLGTKVLSHIKFLIFGHVAHKIGKNLWHIKKWKKSAVNPSGNCKKKLFFENLKISKCA